MTLFTTRNKAAACALIALTGLAIVTASSADEHDKGPKGPKPDDVRVINSAAEPVPVTGSLGISGTASVKAQQDGAWNVGILGTPTVGLDSSKNTVRLQEGTAVGLAPGTAVGLAPGTSVGISGTPAVCISPSANTVQVSSSDQNPVKVQVVGGAGGEGTRPAETQKVISQHTVTAPDPVTQSIGMELYTVPAGKRLVVEDISAWSNAGYTNLSTPEGQPKITALWLETSKLARFLGTDGNANIVGAGDQTTLYVDAGEVVHFYAARTLGTRGGAGFQVRATMVGHLEDAP